MKNWKLHIVFAITAVALIVATPFVFPNERHTGKQSIFYNVKPAEWFF